MTVESGATNAAVYVYLLHVEREVNIRLSHDFIESKITDRNSLTHPPQKITPFDFQGF